MEVYCQTRFEGFHSWSEAPDEVAFLRDEHRHEFHVRLAVEVGHDDRDVEFILLKRELESFIDAELADEDLSCEQYGQRILSHFSRPESMVDGSSAMRVDVNEDGENGAIVTTADL